MEAVEGVPLYFTIFVLVYQSQVKICPPAGATPLHWAALGAGGRDTSSLGRAARALLQITSPFSSRTTWAFIECQRDKLEPRREQIRENSQK